MLKELLLRVWDKIAVWGIIVFTVVIFIAIFLSGGDSENAEEFRRNMGQLKENRSRNRGRQDVTEQVGDDLRDTLEATTKRREELEREVRENNTDDARRDLADFLNKYGE